MQQQQSGRRTAASGERLVKSAYRVMQVFELFSERRAPVNATEIARGLGIPQSSTSMLLRSLMSLGYLEYQHESRTFRPSIRLSLLAGWAPDQLPVADRLLTLLRQLHGLTGETVMLGAPHRHYSRCIFVLNGTAPESPEAMIGDLSPLSTTAAGHVLLTLKSEAELRGIVRRANAEEEDASRRVSPAALLERLDRCRAQGFAYTEDRADDEATGMVAVLLPPHEDGTPLCLAITGPSRRIRPNHAKIVRQLRDVVEQLTAGSSRPEPRVAVGDVRRDVGFARPDLHLVRPQFAGLAETQRVK